MHCKVKVFLFSGNYCADSTKNGDLLAAIFCCVKMNCRLLYKNLLAAYNIYAWLEGSF